MTLKTVIAAPFYHSRTEKLGKGELIFYYAYDRKWMEADQAQLLISRGLEQKLLGTDGDMYYLLFDIGEVEIPIGYHPTSAIFDVNDPVEQLIERIAKNSGISTEGIVSEMNAIISGRFDGSIRPEAALIILAKVHHTQFEDMIEPMRSSLLK